LGLAILSDLGAMLFVTFNSMTLLPSRQDATAKGGTQKRACEGACVAAAAAAAEQISNKDMGEGVQEARSSSVCSAPSTASCRAEPLVSVSAHRMRKREDPNGLVAHVPPKTPARASAPERGRMMLKQELTKTLDT
jgi:hypothetical protein